MTVRYSTLQKIGSERSLYTCSLTQVGSGWMEIPAYEGLTYLVQRLEHGT